MRKGASQFQTIRSEGALLPPDVLRRIAAQSVDGVSPESYHLPPSIKLNEAISHSWNLLRAHWKSFQEARQLVTGTEETGTSVTNERWMLPLFQELGYGRLVTSKAPEIDGRLYPIERFYNHLPIHLIGCQLPLDRRTKGARGAASSSPHSLVQEYLNRSEESLWGMVSSGLQLRLLRDNVSLSRQAFVEFDLEAMMEGEVYADFALLWMISHQSRLEAPKQNDCWLEKWSGLARDQGTRVLESLRKGVQDAIEALGRGFISDPKNDGLRQKLRDGGLSTQDYYRQLLRIVYRLLFLFVAEDRGLLHSPDAAEDACQLYDEHYSTARLRRLAQSIRGSKHHDLWSAFSLVCDALGRNEGCLKLGLPALGSFLWKRYSTPNLLGPASKGAEPVLEPVFLANNDLLTAVRALAYVEQDRMLRSVDYRNLGSEELGSVYESLLELHPIMTIEARSFSLSVAGGNERKTSGSYYTPDSLVQCLLDSALEPVVAETIKGKRAEEAESAILDLKLCDPACGSGHFLIAAAHRLARHLARVRTGDSEPSPEEYQHALRNVIGRCIYGVDLNPMAVELCKVSLWIEALQPGKPLSFLEHHIRVGNSLLGATPELIAAGLPDEAFAPIEGDDKKACAVLKNRNKGATKPIRPLFAKQDAETQARLEQAAALLDELPDERPQEIAAKETAFRKREETPEHRDKKAVADAWCAAFVCRKYFPPFARDPRFPSPDPSGVTQAHLTALVDGRPLSSEVAADVARLTEQYQFFHWHLEFPGVFAKGGFDCVLGNPPWEHIELKEKEWFAERRPDIANARTGAERKRMIEALRAEDPLVYAAFVNALRGRDGASHFLGNSGRYPFCGRGRINLYAVFAEAMRTLLNERGRAGCVLPTGIATDDTTKFFFQDVMERKSLASLLDFENKGIFSGVHSSYKFCLFTAGRGVRPTTESAEFVFFAHAVDDLRDPERRFTLSAEDIALLNPNTRTCAIFRSRHDAELTKAIYRRVPVLIREARDGRLEENPWGINFKQGLFNMTSDSHFFRTLEQLEADGWRLDGNIFRKDGVEYLPLYEQNLIHRDNHRFASFRLADGCISNNTSGVLDSERLRNPYESTIPRYWVPAKEVAAGARTKGIVRSFCLGFRRSVRSTDVRTVLFCALPLCGIGDSVFLMVPPAKLSDALLADLGSFVLDFASRQAIGGENASFFIMKQLPVLPPASHAQSCPWLDGSTLLHNWLLPRILELTYTAWDLEPFARDCGWSGPPFCWNEERRFLLRCELDAAFFHLYMSATAEGGWKPARRVEGAVHDETPEQLAELKCHFPTPRDAASFILDTFPIVKRKDEEKWGDYRTKRIILEIYDAMAEAMRTGKPYQTRLEPPPADPRCCHPPRGDRMLLTEAVKVVA